MVVYNLKKVKFPFEGYKWVLYSSDNFSSPFGMYDRKKDALNDVRDFGLKLAK